MSDDTKIVPFRLNKKKYEDAAILEFLESEKDDGKAYAYTVRRALIAYIKNNYDHDKNSQNFNTHNDTSTNDKKSDKDELMLKGFKGFSSDDNL
ncbi:hypothetical protein [Listeria welshimeri]|uniref:hypothetical protein n=1 Tax=Listeria welshimeri TaxID=1643 RepID=UPI0016253DC7|nr:hypothetical protein [Listeria welshimeri]MBC1342344.1 hypothetical protein [Listeria welshimeri]MBC1350703.1 hypothetical protein [Listeria welshimeri]MBC1705848.1 hypothetical protein [Listeria welshimeri]MBF2342535.1 hypothetical protein [Listeria welshimeri]